MASGSPFQVFLAKRRLSTQQVRHSAWGIFRALLIKADGPHTSSPADAPAEDAIGSPQRRPSGVAAVCALWIS